MEEWWLSKKDCVVETGVQTMGGLETRVEVVLLGGEGRCFLGSDEEEEKEDAPRLV